MGFGLLPLPQGGTGMRLQLSHPMAGALLLCSFFWQPAVLAQNLAEAPGPGVEASGEPVQPVKEAAGAASTIAAAVPGWFLPEGTQLELEFVDPVSTRTAVAGDRCKLRLRHDIKVDGITVIAGGAAAVGTVVSTQKRGVMGRGGQLNLRIDYLITGDQRVPLRGSPDRHRDPEAGTRVALSAVFGPLSLLKPGKQNDIPKGATMRAYVDRDYPIIVMK